jgi:hypothetical protein
LAHRRTFDTTFDDYIITSIGDTTETSTKFWGLLLNFQLPLVGGCQQEVNEDDHILWAFDAFNAKHFLKLKGPKVAKNNTPVKYIVTDGKTGYPVKGATVNDATSDANGVATVTFGKTGLHGLKAQLQGSIRSNQVNTEVV